MFHHIFHKLTTSFSFVLVGAHFSLFGNSGGSKKDERSISEATITLSSNKVLHFFSTHRIVNKLQSKTEMIASEHYEYRNCIVYVLYLVKCVIKPMKALREKGDLGLWKFNVYLYLYHDWNLEIFLALSCHVDG